MYYFYFSWHLIKCIISVLEMLELLLLNLLEIFKWLVSKLFLTLIIDGEDLLLEIPKSLSYSLS